MIQACIFDVDGTILDSMPVWDHLASSYLRQTGKEPEEGLDEHIAAMTMEESSSYLQKKYLPSHSKEEIRAGFLQLIAKKYEEDIPAKRGAVSFLHKLVDLHFPLSIATTSDRELVQKAFRRLGILDCFTWILTTDDLHTDKRHPVIYEKAAKAMHVSIHETAVFEDTYIPVHTAHTAGFPVAAIQDASSSSDWKMMQAESDFIIRDFSRQEELLAWMRKYSFMRSAGSTTSDRFTKA